MISNSWIMFGDLSGVEFGGGISWRLWLSESEIKILSVDLFDLDSSLVSWITLLSGFTLTLALFPDADC